MPVVVQEILSVTCSMVREHYLLGLPERMEFYESSG
jgi:hypothetical protein